MIAIFPEIATCAARGQTEELVILARRYYAGKHKFSPKLSIERILQAAGIEVGKAIMSDLGAILAKDEQGRFHITMVMASGLDEPFERNFLLAHMFGHYLFHIQPQIARGEWTVSGFREEKSPLIRYIHSTANASAEHQVEVEADNFAASLLLPKAMLARAFEKLGTPDRLARFFQVNERCVIRRLQQIGLLAAPPANFLEAEQKLGDAGAPSHRPHASLRGSASGSMDLSADLIEGSFELGSQPGLASPLVPGARGQVAAPRAFAASYYDQTAAKTKRTDAKSDRNSISQETKDAGDQPPMSAKGMDRLRALARKIDKSVPSR